MKSIGIITTSHAINYGAVLQAYALLQAVKSATTADVEIINYCGNQQVAGRCIYRKCNRVKNILFNIIIFANWKYKIQRKKIIEVFDEFKREKLCITGNLLKNKKEIEDSFKYDIMICGSDQIWNMNLFQDDIYFLRFEDKFPDIKYISYGASVAEKMSIVQERKFLENIQHFDAISIREKETAMMVEQLSKKNVAAVVDPVYLLTREQWVSFANESQMVLKGEYVLIFMIGHTDTDQVIIDKLCGKSDVKKVIINLHPIMYWKGDIYVSDASPIDFVSLIKNASFIITDSFHATSFSIIFNKEFYSIRRSTRNSRIENLFQIFSIPNRYVEANCDIKRSELNYNDINNNIAVCRKKSLEYLYNALE